MSEVCISRENGPGAPQNVLFKGEIFDGGHLHSIEVHTVLPSPSRMVESLRVLFHVIRPGYI